MYLTFLIKDSHLFRILPTLFFLRQVKAKLRVWLITSLLRFYKSISTPQKPGLIAYLPTENYNEGRHGHAILHIILTFALIIISV